MEKKAQMLYLIFMDFYFFVVPFGNKLVSNRGV